jgi:hypothetical protein
VFQGVLMAAPDFVTDEVLMVRLFAHETYRVFHDRLVDDTDRSWFTESLKTVLDAHFKKNGEWGRVFSGFNSGGHAAEGQPKVVTLM